MEGDEGVASKGQAEDDGAEDVVALGLVGYFGSVIHAKW